MIEWLTDNAVWIFLLALGIFQIIRFKYKWWMKDTYFESVNGKCIICDLTQEEHTSSMLSACSKQLVDKRNERLM